MKTIHIAFLPLCAASMLAQNATTQAAATASSRPSSSNVTSSVKSSKHKKAQAPATASAQMMVPKGAVLDSKDGNYHFTDKDGRKWVYMMTPMGPSRWEDKGAAATVAPRPETTNQLSRDPNLKAIDQGDYVTFVRATPFGPQSWTKKKAELTADERSMLSSTPAETKSGAGAQN